MRPPAVEPPRRAGAESHADSWPADADSLDRGRGFLRSAQGPAIVCDSDADGLAAAAIVLCALEGRGIEPAVLPIRRGEHPHAERLRARIRAAGPRTLVVLDAGSRPGSILPGTPTLVVDHHDASGGVPEDAVVVNGYDKVPVATTSVLAYVLCRDLAGVEDRGWLATFGAVGDLGTAAPFASRLGIPPGGSAWTEAVSLVNAARRAPRQDVDTALAVLRSAAGVDDIVRGRACPP